jgi:hypothetical protein
MCILFYFLQFGCQDLDGILLEAGAGLFLDKLWFKNDVMTAADFPDKPVYSAITLALMQDIGYIIYISRGRPLFCAWHLF